eukprot:TRINITY_DN19463_c0_g1_i1.p2 TRINITY_DN19463_c0_g1~~TRINITY_DN19463_c0_g1_i1.p2  ORF type:complete len:118 (-),score=16.27 TRINITY_DN19463_c0_g1_i1:76-429(-)
MAAASPLRSNAPVDTISDAGSSESADSVSEDRVSDSGSEHVYKQSGQAMPNMFPDETRALAEAKLANFVEAAHVVALLEDNPKGCRIGAWRPSRILTLKCWNRSKAVPSLRRINGTY